MALKNILNSDKIIKETGKAFDDNFTSKEERMQLDNANTADARSMQNETISSGKRFTTSDILSFYWSLISGAYIFAVSFIEVPESNTRVVDTITGFLLGTIIAAIINFFFGSSHGSKDKTNQLNGLVGRLFKK
jgi:hypothetical protein